MDHQQRLPSCDRLNATGQLRSSSRQLAWLQKDLEASGLVGKVPRKGLESGRFCLDVWNPPKDLWSDPFKVYLPCPKNTQFWVWHFVGRKGRTRKLCVLAMEDWSHHAAAVLRAAEVQTFAERCSCLRLLRLDAGSSWE